MTVRELLDFIQAGLASGALEPGADVSCDEDGPDNRFRVVRAEVGMVDHLCLIVEGVED